MDLLTLVRQDTGAEFAKEATTSGGEHKGPCPLCGGDDRFCVWPNHPGGKAKFRCWDGGRAGCGVHGDLADYLEIVRGMDHIEALRAADVGSNKIPRPRSRPANTPKPEPVLEPPGERWQERARSFVAYAQQKLWSEAGADALAYLMCPRGLDDGTIRKWGLGYNPGKLYDHDVGRWACGGKAVYLSPGIVIPCEIAGALWYVQVRRPALDKNGKPDLLSQYLGHVVEYKPEVKYWAVKGGEGKALFGADELRGDGRPLLLCEGEFDALLAWQELGDLVDVCTLGGAGKSKGGIPARWMLRMLPYKSILVAYDLDGSGDSGAADLLRRSRRARRVKVPMGGDLGGFWLKGGDLRAWLAFQEAIGK